VNINSSTCVLVAEDDPLVSIKIQDVLERRGYKLAGEAGNGREAVELTQTLQPDVVLMDLKMPEMDGLEATRQIMRHCPTPVVVLTAYEDQDLVAEVSAAGAGAYLVKPPNPAELDRSIMITIARFEDMMTLRRLNIELQETVTQLKATQQKLVQQERFAAVGQLATGIAHHFNNYLTTIIGFAELLQRERTISAKGRSDLACIAREGREAANLVSQILDFAGKTICDPQIFDMVPFVQKVTGLLQESLPPNVDLIVNANSGQLPVRADPQQLQQMLTNLVINAYQAMPAGGPLHLRLSHFILEDDQTAPCPDMPAGTWAVCSVADSGMGIPQENLPRIFEPFFTTRETGQGIGLGLAQAQGIVRQCGGYIKVISHAGAGTVVTIYLPLRKNQELVTELTP